MSRSTAPTATERHARARRRTAPRLLASIAALATAATLIVGAPGIAAAKTTTDRAAAGAGWVGRQLPPGHVVLVESGGLTFPDYGQTADVVLALDSAHVGKVAARKSTKALKAHVFDYTGGADPAEFYAGSFAKLLNVAAAQHKSDPRNFGTSARHNLIANLRSLECGSGSRASCPGADKGRFSDVTAFDDFSNTIGQSLALVGLARTTAKGPSKASVVYLRHQQCPNGAFPLELSTPGCTPSVDATAFAVQALLATGRTKATAAALDGARWLKQSQSPNGSFTDSGVHNTNSTGLAAQALQVAGRGKAAAKAVAWIRSLQVGCGGKVANRGKVKYAKHAAGDAVRATTQAVPALAGVGLAAISNVGSTRGKPTLAC